MPAITILLLGCALSSLLFATIVAERWLKTLALEPPGVSATEPSLADRMVSAKWDRAEHDARVRAEHDARVRAAHQVA